MPGINGKRKRADVYGDGELVALHRARVVEWSPTAVTALAATADGTVVAVARESGSIELWNTEHWQCMKVRWPYSKLAGVKKRTGHGHNHLVHLQRIPGKENSAISCLAWTFDKSSGRWRLFSGGLDGLLTEWDLTSLQASTVSDSNGGAVWSLAVDPQQGRPILPSHTTISAPSAHALSVSLSISRFTLLTCLFKIYWQDTGAGAMHAVKAAATTSKLHSIQSALSDCKVQCHGQPAGSPHCVAVACDDGALRIFEAQDGVPGLQYAKTFQRTEGRVLSAAWHPDSSTIITGTSTGVIHAWEVSSNRELLRITAGLVTNTFAFYKSHLALMLLCKRMPGPSPLYALQQLAQITPDDRTHPSTRPDCLTKPDSCFGSQAMARVLSCVSGPSWCCLMAPWSVVTALALCSSGTASMAPCCKLSASTRLMSWQSLLPQMETPFLPLALMSRYVGSWTRH